MIGAKNGEFDAVKIGISVEPRRRLLEVQSGNPNELAVLFSVEVDSSDVHKIESHCHRALKRSRLASEWFSVSADEAIDFVQEVVNDQLWRKIAKPRVDRAAPGQKRKPIKGRPFVLRLPADLDDYIDEWRMAQSPPMSKADAIRHMIRKSLDAYEAAKAGDTDTHQT